MNCPGCARWLKGKQNLKAHLLSKPEEYLDQFSKLRWSLADDRDLRSNLKWYLDQGLSGEMPPEATEFSDDESMAVHASVAAPATPAVDEVGLLRIKNAKLTAKVDAMEQTIGKLMKKVECINAMGEQVDVVQQKLVRVMAKVEGIHGVVDTRMETMMERLESLEESRRRLRDQRDQRDHRDHRDVRLTLADRRDRPY